MVVPWSTSFWVPDPPHCTLGKLFSWKRRGLKASGTWFPLTNSLVDILDSMDWFKGKCTGKGRFSHEIWGFPVNVPLDQSIDGYPSLTPKHYKSLWIQVPSEGVPREKTWICQHEIRVSMKTKGTSLEIGWFPSDQIKNLGYAEKTLFSDPWRNVTR